MNKLKNFLMKQKENRATKWVRKEPNHGVKDASESKPDPGDGSGFSIYKPSTVEPSVFHRENAQNPPTNHPQPDASPQTPGVDQRQRQVAGDSRHAPSLPVKTEQPNTHVSPATSHHDSESPQAMSELDENQRPESFAEEAASNDSTNLGGAIVEQNANSLALAVYDSDGSETHGFGPDVDANAESSGQLLLCPNPDIRISDDSGEAIEHQASASTEKRLYSGQSPFNDDQDPDGDCASYKNIAPTRNSEFESSNAPDTPLAGPANENDWPDMIPRMIPTELWITLEDGSVTKPHSVKKTLDVSWDSPDAWKQLNSEAWVWLRCRKISDDINTLDGYTAKLQYGTVRAVCGPTSSGNRDPAAQLPHVSNYIEYATEPRKLGIENHIPESLVHSVCEFVLWYPRMPFHLEVNWTFSRGGVALRSQDDGRYFKAVRRELSARMVKNFMNEEFLPKDSVNGVLSDAVAEKVLLEDEELSKKHGEKLEALRGRLGKCTRLQATCILAGLDMGDFVRILSGGDEIEDARLPAEHSQVESHIWDLFNREKLKVFPHSFESEVNLSDSGIEEKRVLPIMNVLENGEETPTHNIIGSGGFGEVLQIKIHPSHHNFVKDKSRAFALKRFRIELTLKQQKAIEDWKRELANLRSIKALAPSNEAKQAIVTHLGAWGDEKYFYILFPLATGHLQTFMDYIPSHHPSEYNHQYRSRFAISMPEDKATCCPLLTNKFVEWLFRQLRDLTQALSWVHRMTDDDDGAKASSIKRSSLRAHLEVPGLGGQRLLATGVHHDLKPDNILIFAHEKDQYGTFKLGDWGSGKVTHQTKSVISKITPFAVTNDKLFCPETYKAPDSYMGTNEASRPADIWQLGCVFLEVLLWCLEPRGVTRKEFPTQRLNETKDFDSFWKWDRPAQDGKKPILKDAVASKFQLLRDICRCLPTRSFDALINVTERMLTPIPADRITAQNLRDDMEELYTVTVDRIKVYAALKPEQTDAQLYHDPDADSRLRTILDTIHSSPSTAHQGQ